MNFTYVQYQAINFGKIEVGNQLLVEAWPLGHNVYFWVAVIVDGNDVQLLQFVYGFFRIQEGFCHPKNITCCCSSICHNICKMFSEGSYINQCKNKIGV